MKDRSTIKRVMAGDSDAFEALFQEYAPAVHVSASSILRDDCMASEAVRRTFTDIYCHCSNLRDPELFDEWVYRLVVYHCGKIGQTRKTTPDFEQIWHDVRETLNTPAQIKEASDTRELHCCVPADDAPHEEEEWQPILFPAEYQDEFAAQASTFYAAAQDHSLIEQYEYKEQNPQPQESKQVSDLVVPLSDISLSNMQDDAQTAGKRKGITILVLALVGLLLAGGVYYAFAIGWFSWPVVINALRVVGATLSRLWLSIRTWFTTW